MRNRYSMWTFLKKFRVSKKKKEQPLLHKGEVMLDIYQTQSEFVIHSLIAGVEIADINISIKDNVLKIQGARKKPGIVEIRDINSKDDFFEKSSQKIQSEKLLAECNWGSFVREVLLSEEVDALHPTAVLQHGVLTLRLPKLHKYRRKVISIVQI